MESSLSKTPLQDKEQEWLNTYLRIVKQDREDGHDKCGTKECCGQCATAKLLKAKEDELSGEGVSDVRYETP
jgi:hypothetical protein